MHKLYFFDVVSYENTLYANAKLFTLYTSFLVYIFYSLLFLFWQCFQGFFNNRLQNSDFKQKVFLISHCYLLLFTLTSKVCKENVIGRSTTTAKNQSRKFYFDYLQRFHTTIIKTFTKVIKKVEREQNNIFSIKTLS